MKTALLTGGNQSIQLKIVLLSIKLLFSNTLEIDKMK